MLRIALILFFAIYLFIPAAISAIYNPREVLNNKFGIHIIDENDLESAAALVNSSGGDWGYVTIVIPQNEMKPEKWQSAFKTMERLHLIPIIRLATGLNGDTWKQPLLEEAENWAEFLNLLPWFTQNRYILIFNEPNHAKEWGGKIDPRGYADVLERYSQILKSKSADFFILPAGLDASAPNSNQTKDESLFLQEMITYKSNIFDYIDGWTSHSYPNPNFSGSVLARGKGTISTYDWELKYLNLMGVKKELPVFITETGWVHNEKIAENFWQASQTIWKDNRIVAITPFILNYQSFPFADFSWQKQDSSFFHPQYDAYRSIPKINGEPKIIFKDTQLPTNQKEPLITFVIKWFKSLKFI